VFVRIKTIGTTSTSASHSFGQLSGIAIVSPKCYVVGTTILDICDALAHTFNCDNGSLTWMHTDQNGVLSKFFCNMISAIHRFGRETPQFMKVFQNGGRNCEMA
jgi:hypothetical protein